MASSPIAGYEGYTGWDPVAAQADFKATGGAGKGGPAAGGGSFGYQIPNISMNDLGGSAIDFANNNINPLEDKAFSDYFAKAQSQQKPLDIYNALEERAGIPQLRTTAQSLSGQVNDLEDTIRRVEPNVNASTTNSLVTEAQRQGMVNAQKNPLTDKLGWMSQSLGRVLSGINQASSDIGTKVGLAVQGNQQELDPYKQRLSLMSERASRMMTGFTADRQTKLDLYMSKIQAGNQLSLEQMREATDLAKQEKDFQNQMSMFNTKLGADNANARQMVDLGQKSLLINPITGQTISSYDQVNKPAAAAGFDYGGFNDWYGKTYGGNNPSGSDWEVVG